MINFYIGVFCLFINSLPIINQFQYYIYIYIHTRMYIHVHQGVLCWCAPNRKKTVGSHDRVGRAYGYVRQEYVRAQL